ncbi:MULTISPECIES: hypothetical protein [unclassified Variovorax]|uniref:hypothetical protein n=1 Tax=unclassified Variovorax TaxID=663243 RepID=UPI0013192CC0|nr:MULTISPECIES: hypothetical protein [unclassified Variovorax]VTU34244.1 hypothetical protein SRS16CHR_05449 [Variovorax sp. SRS16]VTU40202.1 hypothetical protein E5CHR_05398 [Variovorax sp. PBL-E5]
MRIPIRTVPPTQDPGIVIECIRACVWATVEGRPFCALRAGPSTAPPFPRIGDMVPVP